MLLILSADDDQSTSRVIRWLLFFKKEFVRINREDLITSLKMTLGEEKEIEIKLGENKIINFNGLSGFWFRRGGLQIQSEKLPDFPKGILFKDKLERFRKKELKTLHDFFHNELKDIKSIGSFSTKGVNKLNVLEAARKLRIRIPKTIVTTEKKEVIEFLKREKKIICKSTDEIPFFRIKNIGVIKGLTEKIDLEAIENLPDQFPPSLFQKLIEKKYELRIFYLHGKFYSMAIFSQQDSKTSVDFRNYNVEYPNRKVRFQLPKPIEKKLHLLMKNVNLNCGSIDMIITKQNEFVFLEVNPVGQFGMTSFPCNYYLEKEIAEFFLKQTQNK